MSEVIRRECGIDKIVAYDAAETLLKLSGQYIEIHQENGRTVNSVPCTSKCRSSDTSSSNESDDYSEANLSSSPNEAGSSGARIEIQSEDTVVWKPANTRQKDLIKIGVSGRTWMKKTDYEQIKFSDYKKAIRRMLMGVFGSRTLATHTRSGKTCPIYKKTINRKVKPQLPELPLNDIKIEIRKYFNGLAEELINETITTKCADEGRKYRSNEGTEPET